MTKNLAVQDNKQILIEVRNDDLLTMVNIIRARQMNDNNEPIWGYLGIFYSNFDTADSLMGKA